MRTTASVGCWIFGSGDVLDADVAGLVQEGCAHDGCLSFGAFVLVNIGGYRVEVRSAW